MSQAFVPHNVHEEPEYTRHIFSRFMDAVKSSRAGLNHDWSLFGSVTPVEQTFTHDPLSSGLPPRESPDWPSLRASSDMYAPSKLARFLSRDGG